jgi:glyceraldehyde-3-phosphate dehydrogenase (NADP+)
MPKEGENSSLFPKMIDIPKEHLLNEKIHQNYFLMNGKFYYWKGDRQNVYSPVLLPEDGELARFFIGSYPLMDEDTALNALHSALEAFHNGRGEWPAMTIEQRLDYLIDFFERLKWKKGEIVKRLMWEIGKPLNEAEKEFDRTIRNIDETFEELKKLDRDASEFIHEDGITAQIRRTPLGVVLCMGPFNYPLNESFATLIPSLMMGNTIVFKPPKHGVLLHEPLLSLFRDCFPPGVVNTIYGEGEKVVAPILKSGKVNALAFIGNSQVANILKSHHPKPNRLTEVYGMEAKNPGIVLHDADLDFSVKECVKGALTFNGQRCTALKILFIHTSLIDSFLEKLRLQLAQVKVGMPWDEEVVITPLPEDNKTDYLSDLVRDAKAHGASVINEKGGCSEATIFFPTVLYPVNEQMKIYHEEQFGPVIPIVPFDDIEKPLQYIEHSKYGQQVSIFGNDHEVIADLITPLINQTARVNINSLCQRGPDSLPFTGRKDSAKATLSIFDALRVFSLRSVVATKDSESNPELLYEVVNKGKSSCNILK